MSASRIAAAALLALGAGIAAVAHLPEDQPATLEREKAALDGGIAFFEARLRERPFDIIAAVELADRYMMRFGSDRDIADVWSAERALRQALNAHPDFPPALTRLASVHIARHEFPEALAAAHAAYRKAPRRAKNGPLFDANFELGRYDRARAALDRMDPNSFGYLIRKARFAEQLGYAEAARNALSRACQPSAVSDTRLQAWCSVRQADVEATLGHQKRAETLYRQALEYWPGYHAAAMGLGHLAFKEERLDVAEHLYLTAALQPSGAEAHLMLARIALLRGDSARAAQEHARFELRATKPRHSRAYWSHLARYYAEHARHDEALSLARRDVAQRPGPEAYHTMAVVLLHAGQAAKACLAIDSAITWGPPDAEMLYHAGLMRIANGNHTGGREYLRRALRDPAGLDPDYAGLAEAYLREATSPSTPR